MHTTLTSLIPSENTSKPYGTTQAMADDILPKLKVTDARNVDSSSTTDGGNSPRPKSATSSEGNTQAKKSPTKLISNPVSTSSSRPSTSIDPLSHHILKRTNTENTIPQKLRTAALPESPGAENGPGNGEIGTLGRQATPEITRSDSNPMKEKKKGVSFLSRFAIIGGKKKDQSELDDNESEQDDQRTEGMNAHVFSSSVGANGFIPQHKEPPRYIKVRAHNKKAKEFDRMFLAQELSGTKHVANDEKTPGLTSTEAISPHKLSKLPKSSGAVWAAEFSKDGKYFAAAGRDQVVRIWAVISTKEEREAHEREEDDSASGIERLSAPVFRTKPVREFEGHTGDILDLSWSKNNFLLSSSMDKTVRLWHISRTECLCAFKHKDFVTSIAFHPTDDRFFLAGSLDSCLRLWSIPDKTVAYWNQLPDLVTAVAFSPDGKTAIAGVLSGLCLFYETEGLKYSTQIHVKSSRGKNSKGSKITGIRAITDPPDDPDNGMRILITSNDSRIRIYNLRDKSLEMKFRGHENTCSQIHASFSDDAHYVVCGSEDRKAYIWSMVHPSDENKDKHPVELFEAHSDMVTAAVIAPSRSRLLLSASGDPIYDLCNPPPVTLVSKEESNAADSDGLATSSHTTKPEHSPAYLARSLHSDGNIIITADYLGGIKVFRQDCAYQKRRNDNWETGSTFSKKMLGRSGSSMTRHSAGSHSRRNSLSQNSLASPQMPSDQILSWRNSITSNLSFENGVRNGSKSSRTDPRDRSISPGKFTRTSFNGASIPSQNNLASHARQQPYSGMTAPSSVSTSPPPSIYTVKSNNVSQPPTPGFSFQSASDENVVNSTGNPKYQFWNVSTWKNSSNSGEPSKLGGNLRAGLPSGGSFVSKLSSEDGSSENIDDESEGEALVCQKCGGKDFRARKVAGKGQRLVCTKCGRTAD